MSATALHEQTALTAQSDNHILGALAEENTCRLLGRRGVSDLHAGEQRRLGLVRNDEVRERIDAIWQRSIGGRRIKDGSGTRRRCSNLESTNGGSQWHFKLSDEHLGGLDHVSLGLDKFSSYVIVCTWNNNDAIAAGCIDSDRSNSS